MSAVRAAARRTFRALGVRNYRLYFIGQVVSVSGTWMQTVALGLLVLSRTLRGNGFDVGLVTALQFLPMLLFGGWGGVAADRLDKRKLLFATQGSAGALALALGALTLAHAVTLWEVCLLATLLGVVNLFDNPARQAFVSEMVGRELLPNAISLNSVLMNSARVIGPAIGGVLIYAVGFAPCFLANAASYAAVIVALALMRPADLFRNPVVQRAKGQVREAVRYVWETPELRYPLLAMAVVGIFAFNFTTTLPLLAKYTFHGGAGTYSTFTSAMGVGAVIGGLAVAHRSRPSAPLLSLIGVAFGAMILMVSASPTQVLAVVALLLMGVFSISFIATANATLQLRADPKLRGRVMSLYAIAFLGSTPIGAPLVGWISDVSSPRWALMVGGVATLAVCVPLALYYWGRRRPALPEHHRLAPAVEGAGPGEAGQHRGVQPTLPSAAAGGAGVSSPHSSTTASDSVR